MAGKFPTKQYSEKLEDLKQSAESLITDLNVYKNSAETIDSQTKNIKENIEKIYDDTEEKQKLFDEQINSIVEFLKDNKDLSDDMENLESDFEKIKKLKTDLNLFYKQIFGYKSKDDNGNEMIVSGQKKELEDSYETLKINLKELKENIEKSNSENLNNWNGIYKNLESNINNLLPGATTVGLTSAYAKKREDEENSYEKTYKNFLWTIRFIVVLATLTLAGSILNAFLKNPIEIFSIIVSGVGIAAPFLWLGVFQNKQLKLSKKLIEEYSHKELTTKTFVGFSKEVEKITDNELSHDLSVKLLDQTLNAIAKNPAECIDNHNTSDNPMITLLSLSAKKLKLLGEINIGKVLSISEKTDSKKNNEESENL